MADWYTKQRTEEDGEKGWLFEVHEEGQPPREKFLRDESLQLKFALGGYEQSGPILAALWTKDYWFSEHNWQCHIKSEGNPLREKTE